MKNNNGKIKKKTDWKAWLFIGPVLFMPIVLFIYKHFYLNVATFGYAFFDDDGGFTFKWFENGLKDFFSEGFSPIRNTFIFFLVECYLINFLTLFISYFIFKRITGYKFFRVIVYLPAIIGGVAFAGVFLSIISAGGPAYEIIEKLFGECPQFFDDSRYSLLGCLIFVVWTGLGGLLFQGAMARIPTEVFEAAMIDGITPWKELVKIIVPMIWPTITVILIMSFANIFSASGPMLLLISNDSIKVKTMTISYWLWDQVYTWDAVHTSSAVGLIFTSIAVPLCLGFRKLMLKVQEAVQY